MTIADVRKGQRVIWRGTVATVVVVGHRRVQILTPGGMPRWVGPNQLEAV